MQHTRLELLEAIHDIDATFLPFIAIGKTTVEQAVVMVVKETIMPTALKGCAVDVIHAAISDLSSLGYIDYNIAQDCKYV